jgi:hypothetical protein
MSKLLPNQVYAGLFEILKNKQMYYYSSVGSNYCYLTPEGEKAVIDWINLMGPQIHKSEHDEFIARAKNILWDELKK